MMLIRVRLRSLRDDSMHNLLFMEHKADEEEGEMREREHSENHNKDNFHFIDSRIERKF